MPSDDELNGHWKDFIDSTFKVYKDQDEVTKRKEIFKANVKKMVEHNNSGST